MSGIHNVDESDLWINGGYFILRPAIFDYMQPGDELVERAVRAPHRGGAS